MNEMPMKSFAFRCVFVGFEGFRTERRSEERCPAGLVVVGWTLPSL